MPATHFVVCVSAGNYPASLEPWKLYQPLSDPVAEAEGFIRVVDDSGDDYLYPAELFAPVQLSPPVVAALSSGTPAAAGGPPA